MSVRWPGAPPTSSCSSQYTSSSTGVPAASPPTLSSASSNPAFLRGRPVPNLGGSAHLPSSAGGSAHIPTSVGGSAHIPTSAGGSAHIPLESLASGTASASSAAVWCELDDLRRQFQQLQLSVDSDVLEAFKSLRRQTADLGDKVDAVIAGGRHCNGRPDSRSPSRSRTASCNGDTMARIIKLEATSENLDKTLATLCQGQTDRADHIEFRLSALDARLSNTGLPEFKARVEERLSAIEKQCGPKDRLEHGLADFKARVEDRLSAIEKECGPKDRLEHGFADLKAQVEDRLAAFDKRLCDVDWQASSGTTEQRLADLDARIADLSKLDGRTQLADRLAGLAERVTEVASNDRKAEIEDRLSALDARVAEMGQELLLFVEERLGAMDADVTKVCTEQRNAAATYSDLLQRACTAEASVEKIRDQVSRLLKQTIFAEHAATTEVQTAISKSVPLAVSMTVPTTIPTAASTAVSTEVSTTVEPSLPASELDANLAKLYAHVKKHSASSSAHTTPACTPPQESRSSGDLPLGGSESVVKAHPSSLTTAFRAHMATDQQACEHHAARSPGDVLGYQRSDGTTTPEQSWGRNDVQELDAFSASARSENHLSPAVGVLERSPPRRKASGSRTGELR